MTNVWQSMCKSFGMAITYRRTRTHTYTYTTEQQPCSKRYVPWFHDTIIHRRPSNYCIAFIFFFIQYLESLPRNDVEKRLPRWNGEEKNIQNENKKWDTHTLTFIACYIILNVPRILFGLNVMVLQAAFSYNLEKHNELSVYRMV